MGNLELALDFRNNVRSWHGHSRRRITRNHRQSDLTRLSNDLLTHNKSFPLLAGKRFGKSIKPDLVSTFPD